MSCKSDVYVFGQTVLRCFQVAANCSDIDVLGTLIALPDAFTWTQLLLRCCAILPEHRPSMHMVVAALQRLLDNTNPAPTCAPAAGTTVAPISAASHEVSCTPTSTSATPARMHQRSLGCDSDNTAPVGSALHMSSSCNSTAHMSGSSCGSQQCHLSSLRYLALSPLTSQALNNRLSSSNGFVHPPAPPSHKQSATAPSPAHFQQQCACPVSPAVWTPRLSGESSLHALNMGVSLADGTDASSTQAATGSCGGWQREVAGCEMGHKEDAEGVVNMTRSVCSSDVAAATATTSTGPKVKGPVRSVGRSEAHGVHGQPSSSGASAWLSRGCQAAVLIQAFGAWRSMGLVVAIVLASARVGGAQKHALRQGQGHSTRVTSVPAADLCSHT